MKLSLTNCCFYAVVIASVACSKAPGVVPSKTLSVQWNFESVGWKGSAELTVFDGHVAEFARRRMRVVDGTLRWGSQAFGQVRPGDRVDFTDEGTLVNGKLREPTGIDVQVTSQNVTVNLANAMEFDPSSHGPSRIDGIEWYLMDETLHVGDRAYAPVGPGDRIKITEQDVSINGKPATPLH